MPYGPLPIGTTSNSASQVSLGSRARASLLGRIDSCSKLSGTLGGPGPNNKPAFEGRIHDCKRSNGTACIASDISELDNQLNTTTQRVIEGRFTMVKVPDNISCTQVRACYGNNQAGCPITLPF